MQVVATFFRFIDTNFAVVDGGNAILYAGGKNETRSAHDFLMEHYSRHFTSRYPH